MKHTDSSLSQRFTLTTPLCQVYAKENDLPANVWIGVRDNITRIEQDMKKTFGSDTNPLLFSCRSGAASKCWLIMIFISYRQYMIPLSRVWLSTHSLLSHTYKHHQWVCQEWWTEISFSSEITFSSDMSESAGSVPQECLGRKQMKRLPLVMV